MENASGGFDEGFVRARRNLILISLALLATLHYGLSITKINILGNETSLPNSHPVANLLWLFWGYLLWRYWTAFMDIRDRGIKSEYQALRRGKMHAAAKRWWDRVEKPKLSDYEYQGAERPEGITSFRVLIVARRDLKKQVVTRTEWQVPLATRWWISLGPLLSLTFHTSKVNEYVVPFVVASFPVVYWLSGLELNGVMNALRSLVNITGPPKLTNREIAILIWLCIGVGWALHRKEIRRSSLNLLRVALAWRLMVLWALMVAYILLEVYVLASMGIWERSHIKDTVIWTFVVGIALVVRTSTGNSESLRKTVVETFSLTLVLDFLLNLYSLNIVLELLIFPVAVVLSGVLGVAQARKHEYRKVENIVKTIFAWLGAGLLIHLVYSAYTDFHRLTETETLKDFLVPIGLSFFFTPFIYASLLYSKYGTLLSLLPVYTHDRSLASSLRRRLLIRCHANVRAVEEWTRRLPLGDFSSKGGIREFLRLRKDPVAAAPESFRTIKWGDAPPPCFRQLYALSEGLTMYAPSVDAPLPFLGIPVAEESYSFDHEKFYSGSLWFDAEENLDKVRRAVAQTFGPPSFANERHDLWRWRWPGSSIELYVMFERKFARTTLTAFDTSR